jgi:hypothetical protein
MFDAHRNHLQSLRAGARFTEERIIGILREHDAAVSMGDAARKYKKPLRRSSG